MITAKASYIVQLLNILTGIIGKEDAIVFTLNAVDNTVRVSVIDAGHTVKGDIEIELEKAKELGYIQSYEIMSAVLAVNSEKMMNALKFFGDDRISVAVRDGTVCIQSYDAVRTLRTTEEYEKSSDVDTSGLTTYDLIVHIDDLKRMTDYDKICDYMTFEYTDHSTVDISVKSDIESASITIETDGTQLPCITMVDTALFLSIVKKSKMDDITLSFGKDTPLGYTATDGASTTRILIAPRITNEE